MPAPAVIMPATTNFAAAPGDLASLRVSCKAAKRHVAAVEPQPVADIIDIRRATVELNLKGEIESMFNPASAPRRLPTLLLYNEAGLQLFEEITYLDEYYLTNYEIDVLKRSAVQIAEYIPTGSMVIELGSGNLRKVCLLLQALEDSGKRIDYYALDLSRQELERTLAQVPPFRHVSCHGLLGTYDDGREWLKQPEVLARPKCILHLGSSIGNFNRDEAAAFLRGFADVLRPADKMLIGVDACADPAKVYHAYNDKHGLTHRFILNGLTHANELLGQAVFGEHEWRVIGEYVHDHQGGRHRAFVSPIRDVRVMGSLIRPHDRIQIEQSLKFSRAESDTLWQAAGLAEIGYWSHGEEYGLHMLEKTDMPFSLIPAVYAGMALPSLADWEALWAAWDTVTKDMIPHEQLLSKPIKLRNACIFYLGHIPTFLDIQLTKTSKQSPTEPAYFYSIFERGIDPDVDNPELCHAHSEIPDEWPTIEEITTFQNSVRTRLARFYKDGIEQIPRHIARAIWIGYEHEVMHMETLLYMMLQSDRTLPPPNAEKPDFKALAENARRTRVSGTWHDVPAQAISIGIDDPEDDTDGTRPFGWDNEKPAREVAVHSFQAMNRPITNEEYAQYLYEKKLKKVPASWEDTSPSANGTTNGVHNSNGVITNSHHNGHANGHSDGHKALPEYFLEGKAVRTVYGTVPLKYALDWPVFASYDELCGCAAWLGGRIPTFEEARSIYSWVETVKKEVAERQLGKTVPAVNGHLVNNGVEESPPSRGSSKVDGGALGELFIDLDGANVGFQHWHPVAVTGTDRLAGQADFGGVWEWTSTPLEKHEGFEPMSLYPGYTADFFDGKHNIVLGGSWATHPRIAGRKSFVNWYQRNYPYAWIGARVVRDLL